MAQYYPRKMATIEDLKKAYGPMYDVPNEPEEERLEHIKS
jgi:hypothetical protein